MQGDGEGEAEDDKAGTKEPGTGAEPVFKEAEHGNDTEQDGANSQGLHAADQAHSIAQALDLRRDFRVVGIAPALVEATRECGQGQKSIGVGQQDQRDGRKEQRGGSQRNVHINRIGALAKSSCIQI